MKRYTIKEKIVLGFLTRQDQIDTIIDPTFRHAELMFDGKDIYLVQKSITTNNAIDLWLEEGKIEEIKS